MLFTGFSGPRYDIDGHVISHSLLGNYEDFRNEALKRGDLLVSIESIGHKLQIPVIRQI